MTLRKKLTLAITVLITVPLGYIAFKVSDIPLGALLLTLAAGMLIIGLVVVVVLID